MTPRVTGATPTSGDVADHTEAVVTRRFRRDELASFHGATVDDLLPGPGDPPLRLLFVGINPGLWTAAVNAHFARPGNRFWPALHRAGITPWLVDASDGMQSDDLRMLRERGIGISNVVPTASATADQLSRDELVAGGVRLVGAVERARPAVVAVLGLTAYRRAFARPAARAGRQDELLGGAVCWVLPNPSGLNAHETAASLAVAYAEAARAAGLELTPPG
ncbi:MAG: mismatch-specific DNA-glycosylase [Acidimicrobiales bacterium]|nr:mismatch-specific DNA-glycosylase [Acidimicrobiales bacterium]MCB9394871.1 mismatch-specific DNA-glycosylase [Acidimicrobiaceae bacterium]